MPVIQQNPRAGAAAMPTVDSTPAATPFETPAMGYAPTAAQNQASAGMAPSAVSANPQGTGLRFGQAPTQRVAFGAQSTPAPMQSRGSAQWDEPWKNPAPQMQPQTQWGPIGSTGGQGYQQGPFGMQNQQFPQQQRQTFGPQPYGPQNFGPNAETSMNLPSAQQQGMYAANQNVNQQQYPNTQGGMGAYHQQFGQNQQPQQNYQQPQQQGGFGGYQQQQSYNPQQAQQQSRYNYGGYQPQYQQQSRFANQQQPQQQYQAPQQQQTQQPGPRAQMPQTTGTQPQQQTGMTARHFGTGMQRQNNTQNF